MPPGPEKGRPQRAQSFKNPASNGPGGLSAAAARDAARNITERIPPQNLDAEAAALGSMLLEGEAAGLVAEKLLPEDFYRSAHGTIFKAICEIYDSNQQPDEIVLTENLKRKGLLEKVGGAEYVHSLAASVPSAANVEHYAKIIGEAAIARRLISATTSILREAEGAVHVDELLDRAEQRIYDVASRRGRSDIVELKDVLKEEFENIVTRMENPGTLTGQPTGITELDEMTGGLQPSDMVILAARPSIGKTALALNIVQHLGCEKGRPVLVFSLEMSRSQVANRFLCSYCKVPFFRLRSGDVRKDDLDKIVSDGMGKLRDAPIFIDDAAAISPMELRAKARRLKSRQDIQLVVVDYLQLVRGPRSRDENRQVEVSRISGAFKALARELNVPVLALSQLNRAPEMRQGGKPQLADLRESGALEQDADVVMLLNRERDKDGALSNSATLNVAKQRNGPTGVVNLDFEPEYMRFRHGHGSEYSQ